MHTFVFVYDVSSALAMVKAFKIKLNYASDLRERYGILTTSVKLNFRHMQHELMLGIQ